MGFKHLAFCFILAAALIDARLAVGGDDALPPDPILWDRLRPLDQNPALDSGTALARPCVPGEAVVMRNDHAAAAPHQLGLQKGQFLTCIDNREDSHLVLVDGPGQSWLIDQDAVNATIGFPADWTAQDRDYLVWAYRRDLLIFRESLRNSFEANFFYLLLDFDANDAIAAALLIDSGTGIADLKPYILPLIDGKPLTIISTHSHWDHFGGHRHFKNLGHVTLLGYQPKTQYNPYPQPPEYDVEAIFQAAQHSGEPGGATALRIGQRVVDVIATPGHTRDAIALYDRRAQILFTGDSVYPGLLFIEDWQSYEQSLAKLIDWTRRHPVQWLLGGHVEMSQKRPGRGLHEHFYFGTATRWAEMPPQMPPSDLPLIAAQVAQLRLQAANAIARYDAARIDRDFHAMPYVPVPFPGIASYFRENAQRFVEQLKQRHHVLDRAGATPNEQP